MTAAYPSPSLPLSLLESLLQQAPLDVLLFDTELVCRYAAPAGEALVGRTGAELVGAEAATIFGAGASDLLAALRLAAGVAAPSQYPAYRYTEDQTTTQAYHCWSVAIEPVHLHDYRGREEFVGVLVTLADIADLANDRDRLRQETAQQTADLADVQLQLDAARTRAEETRTRVRTLLTPVVGYLQVLSRHPTLLADDDPAAVLARLLPYLDEITATVDAAAR